MTARGWGALAAAARPTLRLCGLLAGAIELKADHSVGSLGKFLSAHIHGVHLAQ